MIMTKDTMKSVYQMDYEKQDAAIAKYRILMSAVDSSVGLINPVILNLRDPTKFRYSAIENPTAIQPAKSIDPGRALKTFSTWEEPFAGRSEYMDSICKLGLKNMKNRQQYLHPLPSSQ